MFAVEVDVKVGNMNLRATGNVVPGEACRNMHQPFSRVKGVAGADSWFLS